MRAGTMGWMTVLGGGTVAVYLLFSGGESALVPAAARDRKADDLFGPAKVWTVHLASLRRKVHIELVWMTFRTGVIDNHP